MFKKKVIIIGSGIAGISTGCYLQINDYDSEIFELHNTPGGLCTAWKRKGYTFDGCIHSLGGTNPNFKLYHYWNELIDIKKLKFIYHDAHLVGSKMKMEIKSIFLQTQTNLEKS